MGSGSKIARHTRLLVASAWNLSPPSENIQNAPSNHSYSMGVLRTSDPSELAHASAHTLWLSTNFSIAS